MEKSTNLPSMNFWTLPLEKNWSRLSPLSPPSAVSVSPAVCVVVEAVVTRCRLQQCDTALREAVKVKKIENKWKFPFQGVGRSMYGNCHSFFIFSTLIAFLKDFGRRRSGSHTDRQQKLARGNVLTRAGYFYVKRVLCFNSEFEILLFIYYFLSLLIGRYLSCL